MDTPINADILTLTQWFSPAYPVGGFAYSHGLEAAIEQGWVAGADQTGDWVATALQHGSGWNDALFLVAAYDAADRAALTRIDATARAMCAGSERLMETDLLGRAFGSVTGDIWGLDLQRLTYSVAVGRAARMQNLPRLLVTQMFLQAFMSNLVACATRLVPLGQTDAQRLIRDLTPLCADIAETAQQTGLSELSSTTFMTDIATMQHETQYSRIFRT